MVDMPNGKKKMKLDKYMYDLGSCTFCDLCVTTCPFHAIEFSNDFEQAVFRRETLVKQLNYLPEKDEPVPAPAPQPAPVAEEAAKSAAPQSAPATEKAPDDQEPPTETK